MKCRGQTRVLFCGSALIWRPKNRDNTKEQQYRETYEEDNRDGGKGRSCGSYMCKRWFSATLICITYSTYTRTYWVVITVKASKRANIAQGRWIARIHEGFIYRVIQDPFRPSLYFTPNWVFSMFSIFIETRRGSVFRQAALSTVQQLFH